MSAPAPHQVTLLLREWKAGDNSALDKLTPLIYNELHRLANSYLRRERPDHTLQPTALVNEAYLRLVDQRTPDWQNRAHFFGVAAQLMRQVLVDYARSHRSEKRGAGARMLPLDEALTFTAEKADELLLLDEALGKLATVDPRKSRAVELRFFGGLTIEEIANVMEISVATVGRELRMAEAWLYRETAGS
jgi:RNA polymerase sigma factor (TIGR02999 family)